jgi:hypothetical protein
MCFIIHIQDRQKTLFSLKVLQIQHEDILDMQITQIKQYMVPVEICNKKKENRRKTIIHAFSIIYHKIMEKTKERKDLFDHFFLFV